MEKLRNNFLKKLIIYSYIFLSIFTQPLLAAGVVAATAFFVYRRRKDAKSKHNEDKLEDRIVLVFHHDL